MVGIISDTTWLKSLNLLGQTTYEHIVAKTSEKLIEIFKAVENEITKEFGEYFTALTAQKGLEQEHSHLRLPLSELWKEKISNNPGFDFHTISTCQRIVFGESKYLTNRNAYGTSLEQVLEFNLDKKDHPDLNHLKNFIKNEEPIASFLKGDRAYAVAFSVNLEKSAKIEEYILKNQSMINLCKTVNLLYLIGIAHESR